MQTPVAEIPAVTANVAVPPRSLAGLTRAGLAEAARRHRRAGAEMRMRVGQLWHWIYHRGATDFAAMTTSPRTCAPSSPSAFTLERPEIVTEQVSIDGTRKWLLRCRRRGARGGAEIETVYIPEERPRHALHLEPGRLHADLLVLPHRHAEAGAQPDARPRSSARSWSRATASANGRARRPPKDGIVPPTASASHQHRADGHGRAALQFRQRARRARHRLPTARAWRSRSAASRCRPPASCRDRPLRRRDRRDAGDLAARGARRAARRTRADQQEVSDRANCSRPAATIPALSNARRITFEYVMLKGVNDSSADARELVRLLNGIPAKINLIPFNPWPGTPTSARTGRRSSASPTSSTRRLRQPVRTPRGRDILAACGQLKSETEKLRARARLATE